MTCSSTCVGCNVELPDVDGPTHPYMLSSPACWEAYGRLLAREYQDRAYAPLHRLTVDTYAVQHPGIDAPQARNSVGIHLARLCLMLERSWPVDRANDAMVQITAKKRYYHWLVPPQQRGSITLLDPLGTDNPEDHLAAIERWARSVWEAWSNHHATVREYLKDVR